MSKRIGELLLELGLINQANLDRAIAEQQESGDKIGDIIIREGFVSPEKLEEVLGRQHSLPSINLEKYTPPPEVLTLVPETYMRKNLVIPVEVDKRVLTVAMANPRDFRIIDELSFMTGKAVSPVVSSQYGIRSILDRLFSPREDKQKPRRPAAKGQQVALSIDTPNERISIDDALRGLSTRGMDEAFRTLLMSAVDSNVSHIHMRLDPGGPAKVRFRKNMVLTKHQDLPARTAWGLLKKLKTLCGHDAEKDSAVQDFFDARLGRAHYRIGLSVLPTEHGASVVVAFEDPPVYPTVSLDVLGLYPEALAAYREMIRARKGLLIFAAPAGTGKTTTIYATLEELKSAYKRTVTIENPIARKLAGVEQIDPYKVDGFTYLSALGTLATQDADHIYIDNLGTNEMVQAALRASRAGALVLGKVDYPGALAFISRILSTGVAPTLLASELIGVVGQRLVDTLCPHCLMEEAPPTIVREQAMRLTGRKNPKFHQAQGCKKCRFTGRMSKVGLFEIFPTGERLRQLITSRAGEKALREVLVASGARTLVADGLVKAADGLVAHQDVFASI